MGQDDGTRKGTSLWNTTIKDTTDFPLTKEEIDQVFKDIKENKIDIHKPDPEIERLANLFRPQPEKFVFPKTEEE